MRLSHLGDVVLALPLFHALRALFPRAELAWVVQSEFAPLLEGLPGLARVIRFERRAGLSGWLRLRDELARFAPELAIDAQGNLKSGAALACSGAARRVGLAPRDWREPLGRFAVTESAAPCAADRTHAFERTLALCRQLGYNGATRRDPGLSPDERLRGRARHTELASGSESVLLQLSPSADIRSWPLERCEQLARALAADGRVVLALSGPAEEAEGRQFAERTRDCELVRHWVGQRGLRELAGFFTAAAERGARYVGCDTGPTHLAAACGLPVTVLCGPHSHLRTGPWPVAEPSSWGASPHRAVRAAEQPVCAPCLARRCRHPRGPVCMSALGTADVRMALGAPPSQ